MPLDHYITLGRSGLKVSPLCLGTMTFGEEWGMGVDAQDSARLMDRYFDLGGNFLDTANMYNHGHSEVIIGDYLADRPSLRASTVIATKFGGSMRHGDINSGGASRKAIIAACEQSLRRLRTDYIDLYWMHFWDAFTPIDETMDCLNDLVRAGKVRYTGFSDIAAWRCAQAQVTAHFRHWTPLAALQIEYSLIERTVEGELLPMARELGLGVTSWSPLGGGALSGKYSRGQQLAASAGRAVSLSHRLSDRTFAILDVLADVAMELDSTPAQVALAWVASRAGVTAPIFGAKSVAQLDDNVRALDLCLLPDQLARLNAASRPALNFPAHAEPGYASTAYGGLTLDGRAIPIGWRSLSPDAKVW